MILLDATTGLRRSELFALKWSDVDFSNLELNVTRSIYLRTIGNCKTEASRKPIPIDAQVAADLWLWKETSTYSKADDWIFASPHTRRETSLLARYCPAENHSSGSAPSGNHQAIRVAHISPLLLLAPSGQRRECEGVQELMRHASSRVTLEVHSQARSAAKRQAQERVVQMIFPVQPEDAAPAISYGGPQPDVS